MTWARVLLIVWLWSVSAGLSAATPSIDLSYEEATGLAARWLSEGQTEQAGKLLDLLRQAFPGDPEVVFLRGQHALQTGQYRLAVELFRTLLTRDPALIRVRLELARALYLSGDFEAARYHFEAALGENLPPAARDNVYRYLRGIYAQTTSVKFTATIISDSNPTSATRADRVTLFGQEFILNPDAKAKQSLGIGLTGDGRYAFGAENRSFLRGQLFAREYPGNFADFYYGQVTLGKHVFVDDAVWTAEAGPVGAMYQGGRLYTGGIVQASHAHPVGRRVLAVETASWRRLKYSDFDFLSGHQPWVGAHLRYALDGTSGLWAGINYGRNFAQEKPYSYHAGEVVLRYTKELVSRFNFEARFTANRYRYLAEQPLFDEVRQDRLVRLDLEFLARDWAVGGFAPYLAVSFERNRSTIPLYEFSRNFVAIGVTREF